MNYIIGDIHGEFVKLQNLIDLILKTDFSPSFIFIGDYIDKGQSSRLTLNFLVKLSNNYDCTFLIGNHEYIWLNLLQDFDKYEEYLLKYGATNTITSFGCKGLMETRSKMIDEYGDFFQNLKSYWKNNEFIVVHSGIRIEDFNEDLDKIDQLNFLFNRYEFIEQHGLFQGKYKVVFGHTGFYKPYVDPYKIGIDTGACFIKNQPLTALCLENMHFYNSNLEIYTVDFAKFESCPIIIRTKPWRNI